MTPIVQQNVHRWADTELGLLDRLWAERLHHETIAKILGRTPNSVAVKASRRGLPPREELVVLSDDRIREIVKQTTGRVAEPIPMPVPIPRLRKVNPQAKTRICGSCKRSFYSQHFGVRKCDRCRENAAGNGHLEEYVLHEI